MNDSHDCLFQVFKVLQFIITGIWKRIPIPCIKCYNISQNFWRTFFFLKFFSLLRIKVLSNLVKIDAVPSDESIFFLN